MSDMYDSITGRAPIATDDLGYIGTGKNVDNIYTGGFTPTAQQLEAMNSGINTEKVQKLDSLATIKSVGTGLSLNSTTGQLTATGTGGTTDYTELENKPTINNVTVTGDLSLSDLGINIPAASDTDPQMNGTASAGNATEYARANHVHPTDTSRQAALTAEQLTAVNSGITAADVEQIETNKTNILSVINTNVKNRFKITANSTTFYTINSDGSVTANGEIESTQLLTLGTVDIVSGDVLSGVTGGSSTTYDILIGDGVNTNAVYDSPFDLSSYVGKTLTISVRVRGKMQSLEHLTFYPMVCNGVYYTLSSAYQPYAMSNAELTAAIQAIQAQLANT